MVRRGDAHGVYAGIVQDAPVILVQRQAFPVGQPFGKSRPAFGIDVAQGDNLAIRRLRKQLGMPFALVAGADKRVPDAFARRHCRLDASGRQSGQHAHARDTKKSTTCRLIHGKTPF